MPEYISAPFGSTQSRETLPTNSGTDRTNFRTSVINLDRPGDPSVFSDQLRADAAELIARYPVGQGRSALLPLLHLVQSEQGYVTPDGIAFCSDVLGITKAQVAAVATFYTMYKRNPTGEYLVSVCTNTLCGMLGGDEIFAALKEHLGVGNNETTGDGSITLEHAECLAACDYAPVVTVNYEFFDNQTVDGAKRIVNDLRTGTRPLPTRGAPLCTFRQIERQIAGFHDLPDGAALAPDAVSAGGPTEVGVKLAIQRGDSAPSYAVDHPSEPDEAGPKQDSLFADDGAAKTGAPEKKAPARRTRQRTGQAAREAGEGGQPTSQHDAPLETSESDPNAETERDD